MITAVKSTPGQDLLGSGAISYKRELSTYVPRVFRRVFGVLIMIYWVVCQIVALFGLMISISAKLTKKVASLIASLFLR